MSVSLSPYPKFKAFYPGTGNPLVGGLLYTAQPGTTVVFGSTPAYPQTTYTDSTGVTANTNPITLDSNGECSLWLSGFTELVLFDPVGNLLWSVNNVSSLPFSVASTPQWVTQSTSPTYISATQFSVAGNMSSAFAVGTAVQATLSGGTQIIGWVTNVAYTSVTTVTVQWWSTQLNNTVSAVATGIITGGVPSSEPIPPARIYTSSYVMLNTDLFQYFTMNSASSTSFTLPAASTCPSGSWVHIKNIGAGALTITGTVDGLANPILYQYSERTFWTDGTNWWGSSGTTSLPVAVRQTVLYGPVDAYGNSNFGGSSGGTTVTMSGTITATAANGFINGIQQDAVGTGTNLSWTGLSTSGTMYLYATISGSVLTPLSTTLQPIYQMGGSASTSNGQLTFIIETMTGYIGNGSVATQLNWVAVGEVTVTASLVSAITWYAMMGKCMVTQATLAINSQYVLNDNLGLTMKDVSQSFFVNKNTEAGYAVGDQVWMSSMGFSTSTNSTVAVTGRNTINLATSSQIGEIVQKTGGTFVDLTAANWSFQCMVTRAW